jgi:signal transduction histidine kinase
MEFERNKIGVLIAEDDFLIAEEITRIVKKLGYHQLGVASNGIKALEMACSLKPDVVLMDVKMPKMNGLEAAQKMFDDGCGAAIIILSAHESNDLVEEASKSGVASYLTKPPKPEEIERAVYIALARKRDLNESQRLIMELEKHKEQLAELNATKDRFFSILAHDMRNPIAALYSFSNYLNENCETIPASDLKHYLSIIHTTSKGLTDLLEELFLWANLRSDRYVLNPEIVMLADVISSVTNLLMTGITQKNIQLDININPGLHVYLDRNSMQTVVRNLVSNAIKFTPQNGKITIGVTDKSNKVEITVKDTGVGISEEDMPKLFKIDAHYTTTGTEGETGSGLGLVLCKELIEKNKGNIWVKSEVGEGTSFIFELPKFSEDE